MALAHPVIVGLQSYGLLLYFDNNHYGRKIMAEHNAHARHPSPQFHFVASSISLFT